MSKSQTSLAGEITFPVIEGNCTGRNGTVDIKALSVGGYRNVVRVDCVSRKRGMILNAGFSIDRLAAKNLSLVLEEYLKNS